MRICCFVVIVLVVHLVYVCLFGADDFGCDRNLSDEIQLYCRVVTIVNLTIRTSMYMRNFYNFCEAKKLIDRMAQLVAIHTWR